MPKYSQEEARIAIAASTSWSEALRRLDLRAAGGNFALLKSWAARWEIDASHFRRPPPPVRRSSIPLEQLLVEHSTYKRSTLKRRLYEEGLKPRACEECGQGELWRGRPMSLILDHVNGVHDDNRLENLRIVCPNCAATLDTHCGRNKPRVCTGCGDTFRAGTAGQRYCCVRCWTSSDEHRRLARAVPRKVPRPSYDRLRADLETMSYVAVGAKYGVSDNAVRKWLRRYEAESAG